MNFTSKRMRRRVGAVLAGSGLALAGAALGLTVGLHSPKAHADGAKRGEVNYVRGVSHDAVSGVLLDEEVVLRFNAAVLPASVGPDSVLLRTGASNGEQARGTFIVGAILNDRSVQRRVTVRPEAIQEFYQLVQALSRSDSQRLAARVIKRIERRGRHRRLRAIDRNLRQFFGPSYGAGTRLDDETVFATYPPPLLTGDALIPYRLTIAGDDTLWQDHINGDVQVFDTLAANSEWERFFHPIDPATGVSGATSVLRLREYRRVLVNRRAKHRVMFVPEIPIRADLSDTGFKAGRAYSITVPAHQPGVFRTVLTQRGHRPLRQVDGRDFSTLFTTVPSGSPVLFLDSEARSGVSTLQKPRVINVTPPNGETFVDQTTDWEDPDNRHAVTLTARRTFTARLRFAQPLDPRTVNPTNFLIRKTKVNPGPGETNVDVPVAVGTFLNQHRLGIVEVEVTPATNLDPAAEYEIRVRGVVKSLGGQLLNSDVVSTFIVGPGLPPRTDINEDFTDTVGRASPTILDTFGQTTTALWAAPPLYDPTQTGRCIAAFMPLVGTGVGAPADPANPLPFDPDDPTTFPVTDLILSQPDNGVITFVTEGLDPNDPATFGNQIEYHYQRVRMQQGSTANVVGRFPLIIRSQTEIVLESAVILCSGQAGGTATENQDPLAGGPTGGLGGGGGPGGYRGGDGAFAPATDADGVPIEDSGGNFTFDQLKFDGSDGAPSFADNGTGTGGGAGGFSGDHLAANEDVDNDGNVDPHVTPARQREGGGGGGHATVGSPSDNQQATQKLHPDGHFGGVGGNSYGTDTFSGQPHLPLQGIPNALTGVPRLDRGSGGAGGGGGGGDDNADPFTQAMDTVGHEDSGGGGGGGGGGAVQLVARQSADPQVPGGIRITGSVIDCSGGPSGGTETFDGSNTGAGAPGGSGAGGSIWMQCIQDDIEIGSGTSLLAGGGDTSAVGTLGPAETDDPPGSQPTLDVEGEGGRGGQGYIRLAAGENRNVTVEQGATVDGVLVTSLLVPDINGNFPTHPGIPMVVANSVAYSIWYNSLLDTPTYVPRLDDPATTDVQEGTFVDPAGGTAEILVRTAPNDIGRTGHPDPGKITPWTPLLDVGNISDRRFLQFRIDFTLPLSYDIGDPRPYVDRVQIDIELK